MQLTTSLGVLPALAAAQLNNRDVSCTDIAVLSPQTCCQPPAGHTTTAYVDCSGCAVTTTHNTMCDMVRCAAPTATDCEATTTHTKCAATPTPSLTKRACTTAITKTAGGCGDCGVTYDSTKTVGVDCKGCALATVEVPGGFGICVCPTATAVTTVTSCEAKATAF